MLAEILILLVMTSRVWQRERTRLRLSLAVLVLLIAQLAAVAHFNGHSVLGDTSGCNICLHAGQSGSALLPDTIPQVAPQSISVEQVAAVETLIFRNNPTVYLSRAPPVFI